ncbi:MAG: hypothetical protein IPJ65_13525 [Archangiaceae bacterium]|nr:hypothetical protein [Archangiaceae bacterium]
MAASSPPRWLLILLAGCARAPDLTGASFACADDSECTAGYACRRGVCRVAFPTIDDAGPGPGLRIEPAAARIEVGTCSPPLFVRLVDAMGAPLPAREPVRITLSSDLAGATYFPGTDCQVPPTSTLDVAQGQTEVEFRARSTVRGSATLGATAPRLAPASATLTFDPRPTSISLRLGGTGGAVWAGDCVPLTLESLADGVSTAVWSDLPLQLGSAPDAGVDYFDDLSCTTRVDAVTLASQSANRTFAVKPLHGGNNLLTASGALGPASLSLVATPLLRTGWCTMPAAFDSAVLCNFTPALKNRDRALVLTETTGPGGVHPADYEVHCRLISNTTLSCTRNSTAADVSVHFTVAELPGGTAQRAFGNCASIDPLSPAVDPQLSFVLKATATRAVGNFGDDDTSYAVLTSPSTVELRSANTNLCLNTSTLVVSWPGLSVERGVLDAGVLAAGQTTARVTGLPDAGPNVTLLVQPATRFEGLPLCNIGVRSWADSPSSFVLERQGDAGCLSRPVDLIAWERIDWGDRARARHYSAALDAGALSAVVGIEPVDPTRSFVVGSTMLAQGASAGSTDSSAFNETGVLHAWFVIDGGTGVSVQRGSSAAAATFDFFVVELHP